ncbi:HutD family protein [Cryobacterium sp. PH29-G1]|uniref:HutD/Ves family protein n=1 Tax=Cryobacterium sp. PH29-G1 TaxID=3046211 RepID=UPI0024BA2CA1|nr:HutD family protein [Cryobacterium sp. PH29-G1]MDJ0348183.1 HutD family protein [Cryobacterium sp. PH29-G1]
MSPNTGSVRSVSELPVTPWRNGLGMTRPIYSASDNEQPDWRISIATVTDGAAFSSFAGYNRAFTPLSSETLILLQDGIQLAADASGTVRFDGAAHVVARVLGAPALAVNVMTRAGHRVQLHWRTVTGDYSNHDPDTRAVILADGSVTAFAAKMFSAPAVIRPGTRVRCTRARLLEIRIS